MLLAVRPGMIILLSALVLFFAAYPLSSQAQVNLAIKKQQLQPVFIDTTTENIFEFDVSNAVLFFRQADIKAFINNPSNRHFLANEDYHTFKDTLLKNVKRISVTDYHFSYDQRQRDSIFKLQPENTLQGKLNDEFYFPGAALILRGQFMLYSKAAKKIVQKGLVVKSVTSALGQQDLVFYLPDKTIFYDFITALGE